MRLEGLNLCVIVAELDRISGLKADGAALANYLGPSICAAICREVAQSPDALLDAVAPWRR